jgi:TolA-binding protein
MHYRIAETHLNDGEHARSIKKFQAVVDGYGRSPWAAWSILRPAEAFQAMGQADHARMFFEEVVTRYPDSEAASEAKSILDD